MLQGTVRPPGPAHPPGGLLARWRLGAAGPDAPGAPAIRLPGPAAWLPGPGRRLRSLALCRSLAARLAGPPGWLPRHGARPGPSAWAAGAAPAGAAPAG
ncbi:MAG: hypothetical protein ACLQK8_27830, partial [Streptosporangiaceae bacterium]